MSARSVAILPNAGLANKLFVWAKAQVFGEVNGLPVYTIGWSYPKIGPLLRGERSVRVYARYFERSSARALLALARGRLLRSVCVEAPCGERWRGTAKSLFVFNKIPAWQDNFGDIREHRTFLRGRLLSLLRAAHRRALNLLPTPVVAVHVRLGDFRALKPGEDFRMFGGVRTPDDWFLGVVRGLRLAAGSDVPVTVFSDGSDAELSSLLELPNVRRSTAPNDVLDLLLMSRASVIVASAGSTFSEWAGFLSEAVVLRHPDHIHTPIRPAFVREHLYEGPPPETGSGWREFWHASVAPVLAASAAAKAS